MLAHGHRRGRPFAQRAETATPSTLVRAGNELARPTVSTKKNERETSLGP